jgi:thiol-disulfide isomerase/thioredoxin
MIEQTKSASRRPIPVATLLGVAAISALLGFGAVYVSYGPRDNATLPAPAAREASVNANAGTGKLAAFVWKKAPEALPDIAFVDGAGAPRSLKDFRGKTVLLNLWATWCAPCREEMPSLDRLQKEAGSDAFEVVALAVDRGGIEQARKFLDSVKVENLKVYADPTTRAGPTLRTVGMPTTILIDKEGRELGRLPGPAAWDSAEAKRLVEAALR